MKFEFDHTFGHPIGHLLALFGGTLAFFISFCIERGRNYWTSLGLFLGEHLVSKEGASIGHPLALFGAT